MLFRLCQVAHWLTFLWLCFCVGAVALEVQAGNSKLENIEAQFYLLFAGPYIAAIILNFVFTAQFKLFPWGLRPPPPKRD